MYVRNVRSFAAVGGCFSWLGQKVIDNNMHACTVHADQEDLTTSIFSKMA